MYLLDCMLFMIHDRDILPALLIMLVNQCHDFCIAYSFVRIAAINVTQKAIVDFMFFRKVKKENKNADTVIASQELRIQKIIVL